MKKVSQLMREIIDLSGNIESNYPELYHFLDETPITIDHPAGKEISITELESYLDSLKTQLRDHITSHSTKKGK